MKTNKYHHYKFNSIIIIESLENSTTTNKIIDVIKEHGRKDDFYFHYYRVKNSIELIEKLNFIRNCSKQGMMPILHFATHGSSKTITLLEDSIEWKEMEPYLSDINYYSKNNLFIIAAACKGFSGIELFNINIKKAPCYFFLGPQDTIEEYKLDQFLRDFYDGFLKNKSINAGIKYALKEFGLEMPVAMYSSLQFIDNFIEIQKKNIFNGTKRHELLNLLNNEYNKKAPYEITSKIQYKEDLLQLMTPIFKKFRDEYLMVTDFPENRNRFLNTEE